MEDMVKRARAAKEGSPFLSIKQAAFYLNLSVRTLRALRHKGEGPRCRKHCRHLRYHIDDLDTWSKGVGQGGDDV